MSTEPRIKARPQPYRLEPISKEEAEAVGVIVNTGEQAYRSPRNGSVIVKRIERIEIPSADIEPFMPSAEKISADRAAQENADLDAYLASETRRQFLEEFGLP